MSSNKKFSPERGQFFWYIKEKREHGLGIPELTIKGEKFDPKNKDHKYALKKKLCFLTEDEAYESLAS